jgi:predicted transcriptional regulator
MPRPEIDFEDSQQELAYGTKVLLEAGLSPEDIEKVRAKTAPGVNLSKDFVGMRRYMVQELLAAKMSNRQIANVLQLSKETVSADRHHNRELYTAKLLQSADVHRARLLKEQMDLKEEAMKGFDASKKRKSPPFKMVTMARGARSFAWKKVPVTMVFLTSLKIHWWNKPNSWACMS